ncbi:MAG: hypothetical protein U9N38_04125 [Thermodesulfobacteriota bacterium]|nr:hypothetical protein [Thermodesulfobacteriota bacterium]
MKTEDLRIMEIQLGRKIEVLQDESKKVETEITLFFERAGAAKSKSEELSLARRIKTLSQKKQMKLSAQAQLEKELRAISNILILKEHEADLKSAGVWENVRTLSSDDLEAWLVKKNLDSQNRDVLISEITDMTSTAMTTGVEEEEDLEEILDAIRAVKEGDMEPEEAEVEMAAGKEVE